MTTGLNNCGPFGTSICQTSQCHRRSVVSMIVSCKGIVNWHEFCELHFGGFLAGLDKREVNADISQLQFRDHAASILEILDRFPDFCLAARAKHVPKTTIQKAPNSSPSPVRLMPHERDQLGAIVRSAEAAFDNERRMSQGGLPMFALPYEMLVDDDREVYRRIADELVTYLRIPGGRFLLIEP